VTFTISQSPTQVGTLGRDFFDLKPGREGSSASSNLDGSPSLQIARCAVFSWRWPGGASAVILSPLCRLNPRFLSQGGWNYNVELTGEMGKAVAAIQVEGERYPPQLMAMTGR